MRTVFVALLVGSFLSAPVLADAPGSSPRARQAMATFGECVAKASPAKSRSLLSQDFRTVSYRNGLKALAETNRECLAYRGKMRSTGLPFAAALAEALIEADPAPLNGRLARAAAMSRQVTTYAPSDAIAMCIARSTPDETAALFSAPVASSEEASATDALRPVATMCAKAIGETMVIEPFSLRDILATASFRLLAAK